MLINLPDSFRGDEEMAMNGIGQYDLYNNYRLNRVQESEVKQPQVREQQENVAEQQPKELSLSLNLEGIRARQNMSLSDVSLTMNQSSGSSFEMKALSYKPDTDEMDKAVSDMQKDSALMQYTYFVGDSNVVTADEDGIVLRKSAE